MGLDAEGRIIKAFVRLDDSVRRIGRDAEAGREFLHRLMMMAVDRQLVRSDRRRKSRAGNGLERMRDGILLGLQVFAGTV